MRLLLALTDARLHRLVSRALEDDGHNVAPKAHRGEAASEGLRTEYDYLICDNALYAAWKALGGRKEVPVLYAPQAASDKDLALIPRFLVAEVRSRERQRNATTDGPVDGLTHRPFADHTGVGHCDCGCRVEATV